MNMLNYPPCQRWFGRHLRVVAALLCAIFVGNCLPASAMAVLDALNLGNPAGDVVVVFDSPVDPVSGVNVANYTLNNGATIQSATVSADAAAILLRVSSLNPGTSYTLTVNNVKDQNNNVVTPGSLMIDQNLHTWFRCDEDENPLLLDASGQGRNGSITNDVLHGYTGEVSKGINFKDVTFGYVKCADSADDFSTNGMTIALWVNPGSSAGAASWARFLDFGNGTTDNILFARHFTDDEVTFEVYSGGVSGGAVTTLPGTLLVNQWQHFVVTMDNSGYACVYLNGTLIQDGMVAVPQPVVRTNNYLGLSNFGGDQHYKGKMDDIRIYTRALSAEAVAALAAGGGPDDQSNLVPPVSVVASVPATALKNTAPGQFTFTRTGSTANALTVYYTVAGTATNGLNYTNLPGSVVIPAGAASAMVAVGAIDGSFTDVSRTVTVTISSSTGYMVADADYDIVTILNNDSAPSAIAAACEVPIGSSTGTSIDVWFSAPVTAPTAVDASHYTLQNTPGVSITGVTGPFNGGLRVTLALSDIPSTNAQLAVSGVKDATGNSAPAQVHVWTALPAANIVADTYHNPDTRSQAFANCTDGNTATQGFDTYSGNGVTVTRFAGLIYATQQEFHGVRMDMGTQFGDGGDFLTQPRLYVLKNPVDLNQTRPESSSSNWQWVTNAVLISNSGSYQAAGWPSGSVSPNTPYVFNLDNVPAAQRTGWGWAIGGVKANGANDFDSYSELRGYGLSLTNTTAAILAQPQSLSVSEGQTATFTVLATNSMGALNYQWQRDGSPISGANDVSYSLNPAYASDSGAKFNVVITSAGGVSLTSSTATLTVTPRTTPPTIVAAAVDTLTTGPEIDVWFDEPVDGGTATDTTRYHLSDNSVSFTSAGQDANGRRIVLYLSGTPVASDLSLSVANVQDNLGHTLVSQAVKVQPKNWPVIGVIANAFQQSRAQCLIDSTNGDITHTTGDGYVWATFDPPNSPYVSSFVGLDYAEQQVFGLVQVDLGYQFSDGGDWASAPKLYLLKSPYDILTAPETDPVNWVEVPAKLVSGNVFNPTVDGPVGTPVNTPITFDLSALPLSQRTGYGWAVGGAPANGAACFLSLAELRGFGSSLATYTNAGQPIVISDIRPVAVPLGLPLNLAVGAVGATPLSYQWRHNGIDLVNDSRITGAQSSQLTINLTVPADAGSYQVAVSNGAGTANSSTVAVTLTGATFNDGSGWTPNGGAQLTGNLLALTTGLNGQARSAFMNSPVYIGAFVASWTYEDVGGGGADGYAFAFQNSPSGPLALGGGGGSLGYSGITPSAAVEFNIYSSSGIAFRTNGATGSYGGTGSASLRSGNPIAVDVKYTGGVLSVTLSNTVTTGTFSTNYVVDIPYLVGSNTAYVGFTGATGGSPSRQKVSNFVFASLPPLSVEKVATCKLKIAWPTAAAGLTLVQSDSLTASAWSAATNDWQVVDGTNAIIATPATGNQFFRLSPP